MDGWHHHARTEGDSFEERPVASGNGGIHGRRELALGHAFEFEHVDQLIARRDAPERLRV